MNNLTALIVDDHQMMVDGLQLILKKMKSPSFTNVDACKNAKDALANVKSKNYDIILMDISLDKDNGIDLTKEIMKINPQNKVLGLSMHKEVFQINGILAAGAIGYVLKGSDSDELKNGISHVLQGQKYLSHEIKELLNEFSLVNDAIHLTPRETEILKLIVTEKTNDEIAKELGLAKRTVDGHRQRMLEKFDVRNTVGLVKMAVKNGLIQL